VSDDIREPSEDEIQALVDDRLDPGRRTEIENWLVAHPEEAARVADLRAQRAAVERVFAPLLERPVPERLRNINASPNTQSPVWRMAAMVALVVVGAAGGWFANEEMGAQSGQTAEFTRDAVRAHALYVNEKRHAVEVNAQEEKHLIAWLSRRLENELVAPDLETQGYRLVGGRLLPASSAGPAAQFMYETEGGKRITLYIEQDRSGRDATFEFTEYDGVSAFWWKDGPLAYVLIGQAERPQLLSLARATHQQFNP
jgi:anti-sigma factor RsiW